MSDSFVGSSSSASASSSSAVFEADGGSLIAVENRRDDVLTEEEILAQFDKVNDYLTSWTTEQKINYIRDWKSKVYRQTEGQNNV